MQNVILADFPVPNKWEFLSGLEEATKEPWEVISLQSNRNHGSKLQNLIRYGKYFALSFCVFLKRTEYKNVIAWQQFFGIILACYLRLFRSKAALDITVMTFIYNPKKGLLGKLYHAFVRYAVSSEYIARIVVFSNRERQHYAEIFGIPESKIVNTRLSIEDVWSRYQNVQTHGDAYISAGRSNRDYEFLQTAWAEQKRELRIICDSLAERSKNNVTILTDCHGDNYMRELARCHAVIVSLKNEEISSGQLVLLHSMMLGKPAVVTRNTAITQYAVDDVTGFVIDKTRKALEDALQKLEDPEIYQRISASSRRYFEENFSLKAFGAAVGEIIMNSHCIHNGV